MFHGISPCHGGGRISESCSRIEKSMADATMGSIQRRLHWSFVVLSWTSTTITNRIAQASTFWRVCRESVKRSRQTIYRSFYQYSPDEDIW